LIKPAVLLTGRREAGPLDLNLEPLNRRTLNL
jgi:hypothetical protein